MMGDLTHRLKFITRALFRVINLRTNLQNFLKTGRGAIAPPAPYVTPALLKNMYFLGLKITIDMCKEKFKRVIRIRVKSGFCSSNCQYEDLEDEKVYYVTTIKYLANGG